MKPTTAAKHPAHAREQSLAAALATFAELGFDGATTRDIAARAGVSLGLLRYYLGGKPTLWRAAVDRAFAELRAGLTAVAGDSIHFFYIVAGTVGLIVHQAEECRRLAGVDPTDDAVVETHVRAVEHLLLGPPPTEDTR